MKKNHLGLFALGLILLVAVITNPSPDRHKEVVKAKFNSYMQKSMSEGISEKKNEGEQAGQALGMMLGGALIDRMISNLVSTDNYAVFSTTKISWEGESKVIGVGAFGNVFLIGKFDDALNDRLLNE